MEDVKGTRIILIVKNCVTRNVPTKGVEKVSILLQYDLSVMSF